MMSKKPTKKPDEARIRGYLYRNLAMRDWARKMLYQKAVAKFEDAKMINKLLDEFEEEGMLCDVRFAEGYIRSARDYRGYGPIKTRMRLMEKGVKNSLFEDYLCESHDIWVLRCFEARQKRFGALPDSVDDKSKQFRFLQQRGFNGTQIKLAFFDSLPFDVDSIELPEIENQEAISLEDIVEVTRGVG